MYELLEGIAKFVGAMTAIGLLIGIIIRVVLWFQNQKDQDDEIVEIK